MNGVLKKWLKSILVFQCQISRHFSMKQESMQACGGIVYVLMFADIEVSTNASLTLFPGYYSSWLLWSENFINKILFTLAGHFVLLSRYTSFWLTAIRLSIWAVAFCATRICCNKHLGAQLSQPSYLRKYLSSESVGYFPSFSGCFCTAIFNGKSVLGSAIFFTPSSPPICWCWL